MKTIVTVILLNLIMLSGIIRAGEVDSLTALKVAKNYSFVRFRNSKVENVKDISPSIASILMNKKNKPLLYFVNLDPCGFVIISGDSRAYPVLAHNEFETWTKDRFDLLSPGSSGFINGYAEQINLILENNSQESAQITKLWNYYSSDEIDEKDNTNSSFEITEMGLIHWHQTKWYNEQCPQTGGAHPTGDPLFDNRVPVGCGAVSMAQIMKYWKWPSVGDGSNSYIDNDNPIGSCPQADPSYGNQTVTFGSPNVYNWLNVPNSLSGSNSDVAKIIRHAGVAALMDYMYCVSSSSIWNERGAYVNNFRYSSTAEVKHCVYYTWGTWEEMMKNELDASHPIPYRGDSDLTGGHAFVCYAYDFIDPYYKFKFNWGWGGYDNQTWYTVRPVSGETQLPYNNNQGMITGLYPTCMSCPGWNYQLNPSPILQTHSSSHVANGCVLYKLPVSIGKIYTFKTGCGDNATATYDTKLELYNSTCDLIASNDDGCESYRSKLVWTSTFTGDAYLRVKGFLAQSGNYTLAYSYVISPLYTITVASVNPYNAVPITVTPPDQNGYANGETEFTRSYYSGTNITLVAPYTAYGNNFLKWQKNGTDFSTNLSINFVAGSNVTFTAVYQNASSCALSVTPSNKSVLYYPGTASYSVVSNCSWTAVSSSPSWCTVTNSGVNNGTLEATYSQNLTNITRSANITVSAAGIPPVIVTLTQYGAPNPPSNDECINAINLTPGTNCNYIAGDIAGATQSLPAITCNTFTSSIVQDVWYKFIATTTTHTIRVLVLPSTGMDALIDLRTGGCNGYSIACSGHVISTMKVIVASGLTIDQTYYIRVYNGSAFPALSTTTFNICVTQDFLDCTGAILLNCNNTYTGNTVGGGMNVETYNSCYWIESGPERVHKIILTSGGTITAALSELTSDLDVFILSSCNNGSCLDFGDLSATYVNASPGTYYIVVDGYNGSSGPYLLTVTCSGQSTYQSCPGIPIVTYFGQSYNTVQVGAQCWLKENLNLGSMINSSQDQSNNGVIEKYCYNNLESNCNVYGGLFQWNEAMQYSTNEGAQGICPMGWHIPTNAEWATMRNYLGGANIAGGKVKETGVTHWTTPNTGATNESGFTALPGGNRLPTGTTLDLGLGAILWSSTEASATNAYENYLRYDNVQLQWSNGSKEYGYSCRCVIDISPVPINYTVNGIVSNTVCYNASQTVTVAGNGTTFNLQPGGNATMIAGQNILYLPNTIVQSGSYMWGYIAPSGPFCSAPSMPSIKTDDRKIPIFMEETSFKIYPNPTTGNFILELIDVEKDRKITIEIFGIWGEPLNTKIVTGERFHEFSLLDRPSGVYFIRVITNGKSETLKIIKQ